MVALNYELSDSSSCVLQSVIFLAPLSLEKRFFCEASLSFFRTAPTNRRRRDYQRPRYPSLPSFWSSPSSSIEGTKCHLGVLSYGEGIARLLAATLLLQQGTKERVIFVKCMVGHLGISSNNHSDQLLDGLQKNNPLLCGLS